MSFIREEKLSIKQTPSYLLACTGRGGFLRALQNYCCLDFRLDGNGVVHNGVEVIGIHLLEHGVHGVAQGFVALLDADADVDVLGALLLGGELEIAVGAGEVQNLESVIVRTAAVAVGMSVQM